MPRSPWDDPKLGRVYTAIEDSWQATRELRALGPEATEYPSLWRRRYFAAITLVRAVGHVLDRVESEKSEAHRKAIARSWNRIKSKKLFTEFIKPDRDSVLKTYSALTKLEARVEPSETKVSLVVGSGEYEGEDAIGLIERASELWEVETSRIETHIAELRGET